MRCHGTHHNVLLLAGVLVWAVVASPLLVSAEIFEGERLVGGDFRFIGRFCIEDSNSIAGAISWEVRTKSEGHQIVLLDDQPCTYDCAVGCHGGWVSDCTIFFFPCVYVC